MPHIAYRFSGRLRTHVPQTFMEKVMRVTNYCCSQLLSADHAGRRHQRNGAATGTQLGEAGESSRLAPSGGATAIRVTYGFLANGVAGPPTVPAELAGPLMGVGTVAFDKGGTFTWSQREA